MQEKICKNCKSKFKSRNKFCCKECSWEFQTIKKVIKKTCKTCKSEFSVRDTNNTRDKIYCGIDCSRKAPASKLQKQTMSKIWKENKEVMSKEIRERYSDKDYLKKFSKSVSNAKTKDVRKRTGETLKKTLIENPDILKKIAEKNKKYWKDEDWKKRQVKAMTDGQRNMSEEAKLTRSKKLKKSWTKERKQRHSKITSDRMNKSWDDEVWVEKLLSNPNNGITSKGEIEIRTLFKEKFPNDNWTCGGPLNINGMRIARDCYSNKLKVMIEYDGTWHFKDIIGQLKDKQLKDSLLEDWAIKHNWKLIRIKEDVYKRNKETWQKILIETAYDKSKKGVIKFYENL